MMTATSLDTRCCSPRISTRCTSRPAGAITPPTSRVVLETVRAFAAGLCGSDSAAHREHHETTNERFTNDSSSSSSHDGYYVTPLIAMFVSAEEDGFMGARGVVRDHPWFAAHVAAFANFEAMGVAAGRIARSAPPSAASSSALLRLYAQGAPRPSGTRSPLMSFRRLHQERHRLPRLPRRRRRAGNRPRLRRAHLSVPHAEGHRARARERKAGLDAGLRRERARVRASAHGHAGDAKVRGTKKRRAFSRGRDERGCLDDVASRRRASRRESDVIRDVVRDVV